MKVKSGVFAFGLLAVLTSCGQNPSFVEQGQGAVGDSAGGSGQGDVGTDGEGDGGSDITREASSAPSGVDSEQVVDREGVVGGGSNGGGSSSQPDAVFHNDPQDPSSPVFTVPGASADEVAQIGKCIEKWGRVPFTGAFTNVRRIKAAVTVFGVGVAINDTQQTAEPALILVDAGVNVMGAPIYNMLNNNGYYCMKVNVNVRTALTVNLACSAKLADNSVQVNVRSTANSTTSVVGVNVGSSVSVNRQTPA